MSVSYTLKLLVMGPQLNTPIPKTFIVDEIDFSNIATAVICIPRNNIELETSCDNVEPKYHDGHVRETYHLTGDCLKRR